MAKRKKTVLKRPRGRPPTGLNPTIALRWPPGLLGAVEKYARDNKMQRGVAFKHIVASFLDVPADA